MAHQVKNPTSILEDVGLILGLMQWVKYLPVASSCSVGGGCGSDLALLWLWCRLSTAAPDLTPSLEISICRRCSPKKTKKKKKYYLNLFVSMIFPFSKPVILQSHVILGMLRAYI